MKELALLETLILANNAYGSHLAHPAVENTLRQKSRVVFPPLLHPLKCSRIWHFFGLLIFSPKKKVKGKSLSNAYSAVSPLKFTMPTTNKEISLICILHDIMFNWKYKCITTKHVLMSGTNYYSFVLLKLQQCETQERSWGKCNVFIFFFRKSTNQLYPSIIQYTIGGKSVVNYNFIWSLKGPIYLN